MPEESVLIQPLPINRDATGCWTHPAWPSTDDELIPYAWFTERGLEVRERNFEGDAPEELQAAWFASGIANCSAWEPTPPAGDGWFIFSIHDTEDGPICVWVRHLEAASVAPLYAYSANGEDWVSDWCSFLSQNDELEVGDECQRGVMVYADPAEFVDADAIIDSMAESAHSSDLGEWADDFPSVSDEAKAELDDLLDTWVRKNCDCSFYRVKNIESFKIAHEDLSDDEVTP